jgi:dUTP pyrophosphatase
MIPTVQVYKLWPQAVLPTQATPGSACWDLSASLIDGSRVDVISSYNERMSRVVADGSLTVFGGERALIPTGVIFDIPPGYSLRLHPRSGLSWKEGITLANCEGVIDSDYVEQTFVSIVNLTETSYVIRDQARIAQAELVPVQQVAYKETSHRPQLKTNRSGGFGSTGMNQ